MTDGKRAIIQQLLVRSIFNKLPDLFIILPYILIHSILINPQLVRNLAVALPVAMFKYDLLFIDQSNHSFRYLLIVFMYYKDNSFCV